MVVREYEDANGRSPFGEWFRTLDPIAEARIVRALKRLEAGNVSKVKSVGSGVLELKVDFGPGYRVYFGKDGNEIVILLGGGTKKRQQRDIEAAHDSWLDYKARKKGNV